MANQLPYYTPEWIWKFRIPLVTTKTFQKLRDGISDNFLSSSNWAKKIRRFNFSGDWKFRRYQRQFIEEVSLRVQESSATQEYKYNRLPSSNSIRLLRLQPGAYPSPIECQISVHTLEDAPRYEALSYTWGKDTRFRISCNGGFLPIYESLWLALQRLRSDRDERVLWIDAICISQTDLDERNDQVLLMKQVFQNAKNVVIWLGEESQDTSHAFKLLSRMVTAIDMEKSSGNSNTAEPFDADHLVLLSLPGTTSVEWRALDALFWRPWFTRVWVMQEVIVSKDAIVVCGSHIYPWSQLIAVARYIERHSIHAITEVDPRITIKFSALASQLHNGQPIMLLKLLSQAREAYSTDDRDKVFALLGIAEDADYTLLKPDYKISVVNTFITLSRHFIERDRTLDVLSAVESHHLRLHRNESQNHIGIPDELRDSKNNRLPTWVPDWEVHSPVSPFLLHPNFPKMKAAGNTEASCEFSKNNLQLRANGFTFDEIAYVGDSFLESAPAQGSSFPTPNPSQRRLRLFKNARQQSLEILEFVAQQRWRQWEKMALDIKTYPTGESSLEAFIRTLVADADRFASLTSGSLQDYYNVWRKFWSKKGLTELRTVQSVYMGTSPDEIPLITEYIEAQMKAAYGRRFFTTAKGYMGLGPWTTRIGQKVVILYGGKTPYLLKKKNKRGSYQFVGECYVHGIMRGEAMKEATPVELFEIL